jgi:hypothetical protein
MRNYVLIILTGIPLVLGILAISNFVVDPGNVYLNKIFNREVVDTYTSAIMNSDFGMIQEGWNERDVKLSLAKRNNEGACIMLGSSQIMAVSILQGEGLDTECEKLINLGVSGATLEDLAIFSETIIEATESKSASRVYIAVSPWLFDFNKDRRYVPYEEIYHRFLERTEFGIDRNPDQESEYFLSWLSNLISSDYFLQVIKVVERDGFNHHYLRVKKILAALNSPDAYVADYYMPAFDLERGANTAVTLRDGSHVYNRKFINGSHEFGGGMYKLDPDKWIDDKAIVLFEEIIIVLQQQGFEVVLLFTPYHFDVWEKPSGELARNIMTYYMETAGELASKLNIQVLGSYNPDEIGCNRHEFYDFMHPKPICINRIFMAGK